MAQLNPFIKLRGILGNLFKIGGPGGPQLKNNGGQIQFRDTTDAGFTTAAGAPPVTKDDFVTKLYLEQNKSVISVVGQVDTSAAAPTNTATIGFYVVTTAGNGYSLGDLSYSDGSSTGATVRYAAAARLIATKIALTGGTVTFDPDSIYVWNEESGSANKWEKIGDVGATTGAIRNIRFAVANATASSTSSVSVSNIVTRTVVAITTPYSAGGTISVGRTGSTALLVATTDIDATVAETYIIESDTDWGASALPVLVTVGGAPAAGACTVRVEYSSPGA